MTASSVARSRCLRRRLGGTGLLLLLLLLVNAAAVLAAESTSLDDDAITLAPQASPTEGYESGGGVKKLGDKCESNGECGVRGGQCDPVKKECLCKPEYQITDHIDRCGKEAALNESCYFNEQCDPIGYTVECRDFRCTCRFEKIFEHGPDGVLKCVARPETPREEHTVDPAMIGVLVGLGLMFVIMCVVLRLFSKARWRGENRTIFNTPNPRLMNASLLDSKLLHGGNLERRASRGSVRGGAGGPSRHASMTSLRVANSPTGSRRGSNGSTASSPKSPQIPEEPEMNHHNRHQRSSPTQQPQSPQQPSSGMVIVELSPEADKGGV